MRGTDGLPHGVSSPDEGADGGVGDPRDASDEQELRDALSEDPNDVAAFARLAEIVRRLAAEHHREDDPVRAAGDAVWALAEELAHSNRAWYPLVEMARLSIGDDRENAMRRLGTAAERDPTGRALAMGLQMLRETGHSAEALNLGVGHWRPQEHEVEAGRHVVEAALEAGRRGEARKHLESLSTHPDKVALAPVLERLERLMAAVERQGPGTIDLRSIDLREGSDRSGPGLGWPWGRRRR